ncbi:MAG TPA: glutamate--tRNA ligase [Chitinophagaceae bacterium]
MASKVRVRFAPSPTGGLHLGGVRTVLYNYLFARKHGGDFILRIEDTDQNRFVEGAEQYIFDCLEWCGLVPDESVHRDGGYGPYRQSERKEIYRKYAEQLVKNGFAYYAFDTPEELEEMRQKFRTHDNPTPQYNQEVRERMRNSLTMGDSEVDRLLGEGAPYVIRIKMPLNEEIRFTDMIRGEVSFHSALVDDKVLLKADGMPTYHLAVVVDDYLMKVSHAFRGEEWLPSAPVHILLWKYLFGLENMPQWAHLPLILKPDGNGKLSKRDGDRLGFPVFAMDWTDPRTGEKATGFRESGFLPEAFVNMLAMLGWNDGTEQEIFTIDELVDRFSLDRVHKAGAKFDFEKAKWFNHEWIRRTPAEHWMEYVRADFARRGIIVQDEAKFTAILEMVKDRCTLLTDFYDQCSFFFLAPAEIDLAAIKGKWTEARAAFFADWSSGLKPGLTAADMESSFKELAGQQNLKTGELMLPLRVMLVGGKFGPGVFEIASQIGSDETRSRISTALKQL